MKKILALSISLLLVLSLVACKTETPSPSPSPTAAAEQTPAPTAPPDETPKAAATQNNDEDSEELVITREEALEYMQNDIAPDFELEDLDGNIVSLEDYRGKIILLNFWQTWCGPCQKEMPEFETLVKENDDLIVLGVNSLSGEGVASLSQAEAQVRSFISDNGYTFPILLDRSANAEVFSQDLYISQGIPANYFIDREGILRISYPGQLQPEVLELIIEMMRALDNE